MGLFDFVKGNGKKNQAKTEQPAATPAEPSKIPLAFFRCWSWSRFSTSLEPHLGQRIVFSIDDLPLRAVNSITRYSNFRQDSRFSRTTMCCCDLYEFTKSVNLR